MNWMLIAVLAILILGVFYGMQRGLIRVVYSMVVGIVILFVMGIATPKVAEICKDKTKLDERFTAAYEASIEKMVEEKLKESGSSATKVDNLEDIGIHIPQFVLDKVDEAKNNATDAATDAAEKSGAYNKLATVLSDYTILGITMLVLAIILIIIYFILERVLNIISKLPVIHQANKLGGGILGFVDAILIVWIAFGVITLFSGTPAGVVCNEKIQDSSLLVWIYDNNLLLKLVLLFF